MSAADILTQHHTAIAPRPTDGAASLGRDAGEDIAISARNLGKMYHLYDRPQDRLKQAFLWGRKQLYREFWALRDVSFEVRRGEALGIIGRNGAGKSTLLQILAGTLPPTTGEVQIRGRVAALLELGSGFNPEFTGRENVYLNGAILGFSREEMDERFDEIAAFADIGEFIDQPVKFYSSGMFVRLAFAVQACLEPDGLIVDEVLSVGDIFFQQKCALHVQRLMERGTSILLVSHDPTTISRLCHRALLLADGQVAAIGPPKLVLQQYVANLYAHSPNDQSTENLRQHASIGLLGNNRRTLELQPIPQRVFRHGDGAMRVLRFGLYMLDNITASQIEAGEIVRLVLDIECYESGLVPNVGFQIKDRFGHIASGTNTWMLAVKMDEQTPGAVTRVTFEIQVMLGSGEYTISVAVASNDAKPERIYDWVDQLTSFVVMRSQRQWVDGLAFCPTKVKCLGVFANEG